jgi:hypothetical protein
MATNKPKMSATEPATPATLKLATKWRVLISAVILFHLAAVIAAPFSNDPSSDLQRETWKVLSPYIFATYLNHGYRFFAPNPSAGHVLRYELEMANGTKSTGQFPDLKSEWPRLMYHRHFMLVEKIVGLLPPPKDSDSDIPPEMQKQLEKQRKEMQELYDTVAQCYATHLLESTGAKRVTLQLAVHELPPPRDVLRGRPLNDPNLFQTLWSKTYDAKSL